jgi:hypothetical protein
MASEKHSRPYQALSYVWGEEGNRETIEINDKVLEVTKNLHEALTCLRRDSSRILCVDAVCIDQKNKEEKPFQIMLMVEIYGSVAHIYFNSGR